MIVPVYPSHRVLQTADEVQPNKEQRFTSFDTFWKFYLFTDQKFGLGFFRG